MRAAVRAARARRWAFTAAVLVQLAVLYWPREVVTAGIPGVDKLVHVAVFAAVAWTGRAAGVSRVPLTLVLAVHAVVSEALQAAVLSARSGDPLDVVADLAGIAAGMLLALPAGDNGARGRSQRAR